MMNFSFGGPFSGIHQFAAKFGHDAQTGAFTTGAGGQDHTNRYHTNTNHFNQNSTSGKFICLKNVFLYYPLNMIFNGVYRFFKKKN